MANSRHFIFRRPKVINVFQREAIQTYFVDSSLGLTHDNYSFEDRK